MHRKTLIGGSFAPPLTDAILDDYKSLAASAPAEVRDAMQTLLKCVCHWWELPESSPEGSHPHQTGIATIVPLDDNIASELYDDIPWTRELEAMGDLFDEIVDLEINSMGKLFDGIDPVSQRDLRNAAFHLLWHVKELDLDREPMTSDKL